MMTTTSLSTVTTVSLVPIDWRRDGGTSCVYYTYSFNIKSVRCVCPEAPSWPIFLYRYSLQIFTQVACSVVPCPCGMWVQSRQKLTHIHSCLETLSGFNPNQCLFSPYVLGDNLGVFPLVTPKLLVRSSMCVIFVWIDQYTVCSLRFLSKMARRNNNVLHKSMGR